MPDELRRHRRLDRGLAQPSLRPAIPGATAARRTARPGRRNPGRHSGTAPAGPEPGGVHAGIQRRGLTGDLRRRLPRFARGQPRIASPFRRRGGWVLPPGGGRAGARGGRRDGVAAGAAGAVVVLGAAQRAGRGCSGSQRGADQAVGVRRQRGRRRTGGRVAGGAQRRRERGQLRASPIHDDPDLGADVRRRTLRRRPPGRAVRAADSQLLERPGVPAGHRPDDLRRRRPRGPEPG